MSDSLNEFGNRLHKLRVSQNLTQAGVAKLIKGLTQSHYSKYELGKVWPGSEIAIALANLFGVTTDWLLKGVGPGPDEVKDLRIPVFGCIPADVETLQNDLAESFMDLPEGVAADFACQVTGDSMKYVGIHEGDIAFVRRSDSADAGQIIAVHQSADDDAIRLGFFCEKNGQACLRSANPDYGDILLTPQHHVDGVVVALLKKQVPALADYERLLDHKHLLDAIWSEIAALATKNEIPAEFVKKLIEVQVAMAEKRA